MPTPPKGPSELPASLFFSDRFVSSSLESLQSRKKEFIFATILGLCLGIAFLASPVLGLVLVGIGLLVILALTKPVFLAYLTVLAVIFLSGMSRGQLIPFFIPNEPILAGAAALAIPIVLSRRAGFPSRISIMTVGWMSLAFGTSIFPFLIYMARGVNLSVSEIFSLIAPLQYLLIYWIFRYLPSSEKDVRIILRLMLICAALVGIIGLLQTFRVGFVLDILNTWYRSSHEEVALEAGRVSSLLGAWNSLGTFLMLSLIILRACITVQPALMSRKTFLFVALCCAGCLIASGSYAGFGGLILGLFMFELFDKRGRGAMVAILFGTAIMAIPLSQNILQRIAYQYRDGGLIPQTLAFRFEVWRKVFWPIIEKTWLWGFRPIMPTTLSWLYPESQYFELLLRSGIISLLAHLLWIGLTLAWLIHIIRTDVELRRFLAISTFILFIILSIMGLTNGVFTYSGVIEYLWILIALIGALENKPLEIKHDANPG